MKIAFVQDKLIEKIGPESISAVLKANGHECTLFCNEGEKDLISSIKNYKPDIVGLGFTSHELDFAISTATKIRSFTKTIVFGGHHPTLFPEMVNEPFVDIVCRGEAEYSMLDIANGIKEVRGTWTKDFKGDLREPIDLDSLPFLDRSIYYKYPRLKNAPMKPFMISRGCPYNCSFCFNDSYHKLFGVNLRFRNPHLVEKELLELKKDYGYDWIQFHDSSFNLNPYLDKMNLPPYICNVRIDTITESIIRKMSNCDKVTIGVQSGSREVREKLALRGSMTNLEITEKCNLFKKYGIRTYLDFITGWPTETVSQAFESVALAKRINPTGVNCYILTPYKGTHIYDFCQKNNFITDTDYGAFGSHSIISQRNMNKLINLQKLFYYAVYENTELVRKLINYPPNKIFSILEVLPRLKRQLKYNSPNLLQSLRLIWKALCS